MEARAKAVRTAAAVRRWRYRQRHLAAGVWFKFRLVLARASAVYAISAADARRLLDEGYGAEPCGRQLAPEKTLLFVDARRLSTIAERRPLRVGLGPDVLTAPILALVPFDDEPTARA
jgi:hypothetical protein